MTILPTKKIIIQLKVSFLPVFLLTGSFAFLNGHNLFAQSVPGRALLKKNNFSTFTRKYTDRGKFWIIRNKAYLQHPDAHFDDKYSHAKNAVELFEKRTIDSKYLINKDSPSICYVQKSSSPMHFKKNGQWITIDPRLGPKGQLLYEASNQEHPIGFDIRRKSSYFKTPDGRTYFNNWKIYGELEGKEKLLANADWTNYTAGDDGIAIKNIFPGIDAEMKLSRGSVKTNFIVNANKFPTYKTLLIRDSFFGDRGGNLSFSGGLSGNGLTSAADFRVSARTIFHIKQGIMYLEKNPSSNYQFIPYFIDKNKLTLAVNTDFLNAQLKIGNVIIDPLVQDDGILQQDKIKGSQLNNDCSLTKACQYNFNVPSPVGSTIVDVLFSFGFNAYAPCVGQDGAFSFAVGGGNCHSPMWVGSSSGTGPEIFANQDMLLNNGGSLAGCFPKPGKPNCTTPQNIPFSFYFYRSCKGPNGCDGSCIGAAEDLTITVVGRTFDSASENASANNICPGTPVILTANGFYGIPPYTFNWVGLNQNNGDSTIQVSPVTNTVYTVLVTDQCSNVIPPASVPITKTTGINIIPLPSPSVSISSSATSICAGTQVSFNSVLSNGGNSNTYQWQVNGNNVGTNSPVFIGNSFANNDAIRCIVIATGQCGTGSDTSNVIVLTVGATGPPSFDPIGPFCKNSLPPALPLTSKEGVPGTWNPAIINTAVIGTTSYTFTPSPGQCASPVSINITIVASITPTFPTVPGSLCQHSIAPLLPPISNEGVPGTWNPSVINTSKLGTTSYTFTPAPGQCSSPVTLNINIVRSLTPTFPTIPGTICQGTTAPQLPSTSLEGVTGIWNPSSISTEDVGSSSYTFTPAAGQCGTTAQITIVIAPLPTLNMGPDLTIAAGTSTTLNPSVTGNIVTYQWSPVTGLSNPNIRNPVASPSSTTVYTLNITDDNQCEANASITITVTGKPKISVPNAFSPNGDGVNDTWVITNLSAFPGATVDVFNRYGQLVYHSENYSRPWDGTFNGNILPMATYYYIIDPKNNEKKISGSVTLFK